MFRINQSEKMNAAASHVKSNEINWKDMHGRSSFQDNTEETWFMNWPIDKLAGPCCLIHGWDKDRKNAVNVCVCAQTVVGHSLTHS